jgi:N-acetyl-gamma-glutamylphosphate reductase
MLSSVARRFSTTAGKTWKGGAKPNVAVVGATGAVGNDLLRVLEQRNFPVGNVCAFVPKSKLLALYLSAPADFEHSASTDHCQLASQAHSVPTQTAALCTD